MSHTKAKTGAKSQPSSSKSKSAKRDNGNDALPDISHVKVYWYTTKDHAFVLSSAGTGENDSTDNFCFVITGKKSSPLDVLNVNPSKPGKSFPLLEIEMRPDSRSLLE